MTKSIAPLKRVFEFTNSSQPCRVGKRPLVCPPPLSHNRSVRGGPPEVRPNLWRTNRLVVNQTRYVINSQPALSQVLVKEENGIKTFYVYGLGLIGEEKVGEYRAYHFDFRGSTVALSDKTGKVVQRFQYGPYGELVKGDASQTPFLFNGKFGVMTEGNGLAYMRARFYSPVVKRFVNMDVLLGNISEGQTLNRFAFVTGQPVNYLDPFGLDKYCGQCAPGAYDCLIYHFNLCEPDTLITDVTGYLDAWEILAEHRQLMNEVNDSLGWKNGLDKYFHCKAHCRAERRGIGSYALKLGDIREYIQEHVTGYSPEDCEADRRANHAGVEGVKLYPTESCENICAIQVGRPDIPPQY